MAILVKDMPNQTMNLPEILLILHVKRFFLCLTKIFVTKLSLALGVGDVSPPSEAFFDFTFKSYGRFCRATKSKAWGIIKIIIRGMADEEDIGIEYSRKLYLWDVPPKCLKCGSTMMFILVISKKGL